jgi:hypothetical protein
MIVWLLCTFGRAVCSVTDTESTAFCLVTRSQNLFIQRNNTAVTVQLEAPADGQVELHGLRILPRVGDGQDVLEQAVTVGAQHLGSRRAPDERESGDDIIRVLRGNLMLAECTTSSSPGRNSIYEHADATVWICDDELDEDQDAPPGHGTALAGRERPS